MGDKKSRSVGQCILGLKAKLVSASPRQRGQPAGFRRELRLMGIGPGRGGGGAGGRLPQLAWSELPQVEGEEGTGRVPVRTISCKDQLARDLGQTSPV